jgi:signal transduction histidine kinase
MLLAKSERPDFLATHEIDVTVLVEDVFVRWADVVPRVWRLGPVVAGTLVADEEAVRTALDALVENAVKHTEPREAIELRARQDGGELVLEVADAGHGIPAREVDRIFERFARVDDDRNRETGGAGLGLAIVAAIAKAHGGNCGVTRQARGTVFTLRLPRFTRHRVSALELAAR